MLETLSDTDRLLLIASLSQAWLLSRHDPPHPDERGLLLRRLIAADSIIVSNRN